MECTELPWIEPTSAFLAQADDPHLVFFDSAAPDDVRSEVSYLCTSPLTCLRLEFGRGDPFLLLKQWRIKNRPIDNRPPDAWPFPFSGGAAGWIGYDLGLQVAEIKSRFVPIQDLPGGWFGLYDTIIGFDHAREQAWALTAERHGSSATARLKAMAAILAAPPSHTEQTDPVKSLWRTETSRADYSEGLARLHTYIGAGDVYQANFTTRFLAVREDAFSPTAFYLALRARSPAPFASYMSCGDGVVILGASPERFLRLGTDGRVETRPIKGTAPRQKNKAADRRAARTLHASAKERAENLMIVDLMRNDVGQVCELGSVTVSELFSVESFAQAHHLVSAVRGQLRVGLAAEDLLRATFPGGSITGAPKRRAMEIIDEIEAGPRGAYCGMAGWIGFDGAMDRSIIIRTLVATATSLFAQAGGGITWDSETASEYDEMMLKLSPLLACEG